MNKLREITEELRLVFTGRGTLVDSLLPPLLFVVCNTIWGNQVAFWTALGLAVIILSYRLARRQPYRYALGGFVGIILAVVFFLLLGRVEGFYLPTLVSGAFSVLLCLVSVVLGRPIVAYTSFVTRRWPIKWYWHPKVRPAYSEVTWIWFVFFGLRLLLQLNLLRDAAANLLGIVQLLTGWPATILLLIGSYLYGTWRLQNLGGPSVEEYKSGVEPPWQGQKRGF
jgi:hypothetical protein